MGAFTHNLEAQLTLLYELTEPLPMPAMWADAAIMRGLQHRDPDMQELAIGAAANVPHTVMLPILLAYSRTEREPWLLRFTELVIADYDTRP